MTEGQGRRFINAAERASVGVPLPTVAMDDLRTALPSGRKHARVRAAGPKAVAQVAQAQAGSARQTRAASGRASKDAPLHSAVAISAAEWVQTLAADKEPTAAKQLSRSLAKEEAAAKPKPSPKPKSKSVGRRKPRGSAPTKPKPKAASRRRRTEPSNPQKPWLDMPRLAFWMLEEDPRVREGCRMLTNIPSAEVAIAF
eukprot:COSAG04_NODE_11570_length_701_cov_1.244186_1_plen_198_part_10